MSTSHCISSGNVVPTRDPTVGSHGNCNHTYLIVNNLILCSWLVKKGKMNRANKILSKTRQGASEGDVKEELSSIESTLEDTKTYLDVLRIFVQWRVFERYVHGWHGRLIVN